MVISVTNRCEEGSGLEYCGGLGRKTSPGILFCLSTLAVLFLVVASTSTAAVGVTFTVNSTADTPDANVGDGFCADATGACTLRAAIQESNETAGFTDTIEFDLPTPPFSIAPATDLPDITDPVAIDGFSQGGPGYAGPPIVELRGPGENRGLLLIAGDSTMRGLVINRFQEQLRIDATAGDGNRIGGNFIGTDVTGMLAAPHPSGVASGIIINGGTDHVIGGSDEGDRNVISGHRDVGIHICGQARIPFEVCQTGKVTIQGNYIGVNKDGDAAVAGPPGGVGVLWDQNPGPGTLIVGGDGAGEGNVISGNQVEGLHVRGISGAEIVGNLIGTDSEGNDAVPNGTGISGGQMTNPLIAGNVISGNGGIGLALGSTEGTVIQGNMIGVGADGLEPIPNTAAQTCAEPFSFVPAVQLHEATAHAQIGGTRPSERNIISGNTCVGIVIAGVGTDTPNVIAGNYIGVDQNGEALPNGGTGIFAGGLGNVIGGITADAGNVIAHNGGYGILVTRCTGETDAPAASILGNSIHSNGGLGIELTCGTPGPTENDPGDTDQGSNDFQNFPVITSVTSAGGQTVADVEFNSTPDDDFRLEFFRNTSCNEPAPPDFPHAWFFGEGQTLVGVQEVSTDADGNWNGNVALTGETSSTEVITATATRFTEPSASLAGSTSEFSECLAGMEGGTIVVRKQTLPAGSSQSFAFTTSYGPGFSLSDGQSNTSGPLAAGSYSVSETAVSGWDASASCSDGSPPSSIDLRSGETVTCTFTNTKRGSVTLLKTTNGVVDPSKDILFVLTGPGLPTGGLTRSTFGDQDGILEWPTLVPGQYTVCETPVPAGFTSFWRLDGVIVTPYNPDASRTPPEDLGTRCYDFSALPGQARAFEVDNSHPGGDPRTIGYWKNWNRCTSGNQAATAERNGGAAAGFFLVEDLLPQTIGDFSITTCEQAVKLLSKQDQAGRNKANDAAYELGAQLLAARFNLAAGAETCLAVQQAVLDGQTLLDGINFSGSGDYLGSKSKNPKRPQALSIAATLDRYNNGNLC
jgi:CSLREA domain-containing protein